MSEQAETYYRDMGRGVFIPAHYTPAQARAFLARVGDERVVQTLVFDGQPVTVLAPKPERGTPVSQTDEE